MEQKPEQLEATGWSPELSQTRHCQDSFSQKRHQSDVKTALAQLYSSGTNIPMSIRTAAMVSTKDIFPFFVRQLSRLSP